MQNKFNHNFLGEPTNFDLEQNQKRINHYAKLAKIVKALSLATSTLGMTLLVCGIAKNSDPLTILGPAAIAVGATLIPCGISLLEKKNKEEAKRVCFSDHKAKEEVLHNPELDEIGLLQTKDQINEENSLLLGE